MSNPTRRSGSHPGMVMANLDRPRSETPTRIAVIADPHLSIREEGTSKLFEHTEKHLQAAIEDIHDRNVDGVLSVGDLTKDGEPWNYNAVDEMLAELDVPFYSVPGNHDVPKKYDDHENLPMGEFVKRYTPGQMPFTVRIGGVDVVGLNSSGDDEWLYGTHHGEIRQETLDWLDETLPRLSNPLILVHHNLPTMSAQLEAHRDAIEPEMEIPPVLLNPQPFVDVLAKHGVPLILTGHLHLPSATEEQGVREIMAPTTCSFPQAYLLLEIDDSGTTVRFVPIAEHEDLRYAYGERSSDSATARGLTAMASIRLADFPLIDE
ncbi:MAG: metallophosphoesterase [Halobacteriaceae archaeon]